MLGGKTWVRLSDMELLDQMVVVRPLKDKDELTQISMLNASILTLIPELLAGYLRQKISYD